MTFTKEEIKALLRLIDASQTNYTVVSKQSMFAELTQKLQNQLFKLTT